MNEKSFKRTFAYRWLGWIWSLPNAINTHRDTHYMGCDCITGHYTPLRANPSTNMF